MSFRDWMEHNYAAASRMPVRPRVDTVTAQDIARFTSVRAARADAILPRPVDYETADALSQRTLPADPRDLWSTALWYKLSPGTVLNFLRQGLTGDPYIIHNLFHVMLDGWTRLRTNTHHIQEAVATAKYKTIPWTETADSTPTDDALERADLVRRAMLGLGPEVGKMENNWRDAVYDLICSKHVGPSAQEIVWEKRGGEWMPRCLCWVHPRYVGYGPDGAMTLCTSNAGRFDGRNELFIPIPKNKFIVGVYKTRSGAFTSYAMLRTLAWWYSAMTHGRDWVFRNGEVFGLPIRDVEYDPNIPPALKAELREALPKMGARGWLMRPTGTKLNLIENRLTGPGHGPADNLLDRADQDCDLVILGQAKTSGTKRSGTGQTMNDGGGEVQSAILDEWKKAGIDWAGDVMTQQFARAILRLNYGNEDFCPSIVHDVGEQKEDPLKQAQRQQVIVATMPVQVAEAYKNVGYTPPKTGDEVVVGGRIVKYQGARDEAADTTNADGKLDEGTGELTDGEEQTTSAAPKLKTDVRAAAPRSAFNTPHSTRPASDKVLEKTLQRLPDAAAKDLAPLIRALNEALNAPDPREAVRKFLAELPEMVKGLPAFQDNSKLAALYADALAAEMFNGMADAKADRAQTVDAKKPRFTFAMHRLQKGRN